MKDRFRKKKCMLPLVTSFLVLLMAAPAMCRDMTVSLADLPNVSQSATQGPFVDLIKAMGEEYKGGTFKIELFPFARALDNVANGKTDFEIPMLLNPNVPVQSLPFRYASVPMGKVCFVIYSNTDKPITKEMLEKASSAQPFPYKVAVLRGLEKFFTFQVQSDSSIDQGLRMLVAHRIDAYVHAQEDADFVLKDLKLKNIHRENFGSFDDVVVIPKGKNGDEVDQVVSGCLKALAATGRLEQLHSKIHVPYVDWQPATMNW